MPLATLRTHPADPTLAILAVPADLNPTLGRFEPARLSTQHKGYLVHTEQLDALARFLRIHSVTLVDERTTTPPRTGKALGPLPECSNCGQPTRRRQADDPTKDYPPPKFCPDCGATWDQFVMTVTEVDLHATQTCRTCGRTQRGTFTHCTGCGVPMPEPEQRRPITGDARLFDPQHIGDAIGDFLDEFPAADDQSQAAINARGRAKVRQALEDVRMPKETT